MNKSLAVMVLLGIATVGFAKVYQSREGDAIELYKIVDGRIQSASLFYRVQGSRQFLQQPLVHHNSVWIAKLGGAQVQSPAIEYYLQFYYQDGSQKTEPAQYPRYNPMRLPVMAPQNPLIVLEDNKVTQQQETIRFQVKGFVDAPSRVYLNAVDVTDFIQRNGENWQLHNQVGLFSGESVLKITDSSGRVLAMQTIVFVNEDKAPMADGELILKGNASFNLGGRDDSDAGSDLSISGNLHLESEYQSGDFRSQFSGVNINYQRGGDPEFNLSSGFLLDNRYQNKVLQFGDVSISGTPLVINGFARRGLLFKSKNKFSDLSVFNVRSSPVDGWESGLSFDERQTYGAHWRQSLDSDNRSNIQLAVVSGKLQKNETGSVGSLSKQPQSGDTAGLQFDTVIYGTRLSAQIASSRFDGDTTDAINANRDNAYELKLKRDIYGLASSVAFHRYGANYATIANPNFSNDRQGLDISIGSQLQSLGWTASFSTIRDNINDDITRPVVLSSNSSLNLNISRKNWPSISVGMNISSQKSRNEPSVDQRVENIGQDVTLGISDRFANIDLSWSSSLGKLQNRLDANKDSDTQNHSLTMAYGLDSLRLNLNLSQNNSRTEVTKVSDLINLSADVPILGEKFIVNSQFSYQRNTASDNSLDNEILGGSARLSWQLKDVLHSVGGAWGRTRFSLNWTYNRNQDALNPSNDNSDQRLLLEFSLGQPVQFQQKWRF